MVGKNIKKLRKDYEWTQEDLAAKLDVSPGAISNYERAKREPDIAMLIKMADTFKISIDELVGRV